VSTPDLEIAAAALDGSYAASLQLGLRSLGGVPCCVKGSRLGFGASLERRPVPGEARLASDASLFTFGPRLTVVVKGAEVLARVAE
jgi:hypothetical protein